MDLRNVAPRSPYETLGGIVFLPRAIDKVRGELAGTIGDYSSRGGRSGMLLEFLGIDEDEFVDGVSTGSTDSDVWAWLSGCIRSQSLLAVADFNDRMCSASPDRGDWTWERFQAQLEESGNGHRKDIKRHFDRLDLDEGRDVPVGGRWWHKESR